MGTKILFGVIFILGLALAFQSSRVNGLKSDLRQAKTEISLHEASEKALAKTRDGLTSQVEDCQKSSARSEEAVRSRAAILRNVKPGPAKPENPGTEVDDATHRAVVDHVNAAIRRINDALGASR